MQKKTMIYLDEDTHLRLKYMALDERVSMAELIRRAVADYMKRHPGKAVRK
jgi:predicted transcriptional regulator